MTALRAVGRAMDLLRARRRRRRSGVAGISRAVPVSRAIFRRTSCPPMQTAYANRGRLRNRFLIRTWGARAPYHGINTLL